MVDPIVLMVLERVVERVIITVFAGVSFILGYKLFKLGIINQQSGSFDWGKLSVKLLNVGPGIFFALFGTTVFGILAFRNISFDKKGASGETVSYSSPKKQIKLDSISDDDAHAITTVIDLVQSREFSPPLGATQKEVLNRSLKQLTLLRKSAAYERYPDVASKYQEWSKREAIDPKFLESLDDQQRKEYQAMRAFLHDSYLEEQ